MILTSRLVFAKRVMTSHLIWRQIQISKCTSAGRKLHNTCQLASTGISSKMPEVICGSSSPLKKTPRLELPSTLECNSPVMKFAKLTENALTPTRGSKQAAGFDLYSAYDYVVPAKGKVLAKTDIQIALPPGCYGRVAPRSGLAHKHFIDVGAGVIDQDYRGNVGVILFNFGMEEFKVVRGDRIAQLVLERIYIPELEELPTLDDTERGSGGFGSTGKN